MKPASRSGGGLHLTTNDRLAEEIEQQGVERVVYGMDMTTLKRLNRQLVDALRAPHSESTLPNAVRLALMTLLNHVEPGWDNCRAVVQAWLDSHSKEHL